MSLIFRKASKENSPLHVAITGPPGAGKTYTSLSIGSYLGERRALIDTERGRASKYAGEFDFDTLKLENFHPRTYIEAIQAAEAEGYDVIIIDSLSHAWAGPGGVLDLVNQIAHEPGGSFAAWQKVTPLQNQLVDTILSCRAHVIATMRSKMEYVPEKNQDTGKTVIRKVGLQPIQRENIEYEFDVIGEMDLSHTMRITKSMCRMLEEYKGGVIHKPGRDVAEILLQWRNATPIPLDEIDALGDSLYAEQWPTKRAELARYVSRSKTDDLKQLSSQEAEIILSGLHKRAAEAPDEPTAPAQPSESQPAPVTNRTSQPDPEAVISPPKVRSLRNIATRHQWKETELQRLVSSYGFSSPETVNEEGFPKICSDLRNPSLHNEFRSALDEGESSTSKE